MIPLNLKITLVIGILFYFGAILVFLKNKAIALKYTLLWLFAGLVLAIMVIWPNTLSALTRLLGITSNMNGLYVVSIAFIAMITMSLTSIVSKQTEKIKNLTQSIAKMEKRIRDLEQEKNNHDSIIQ